MNLLVRGLVGYVVLQVQSAYFRQVAVHPGGIKGKLLPAYPGKIDVVFAVGVGAVLLVSYIVGFGALETDFLYVYVVKFRGLVVLNQVLELRVIIVQRVFFHQVNVAVANGYETLGVHFAEIAQLDFVRLLIRGQADGAGWVLKAVLAVVLHILNDEGRAKLLKHFQQLFDFFLVNGEFLVPVVNPLVVLVEGEGVGLLFPGQGLYGIG